jgi:hypothetical protein
MTEFLSQDTFKAGLVSQGTTTVPTPVNSTDAATKAYADGNGMVTLQAVDPGAVAMDLIWIDVDDTSMTDGGSPHNHDGVYWKKWTGTQAAYDAIGTKDPNTLYCVQG